MISLMLLIYWLFKSLQVVPEKMCFFLTISCSLSVGVWSTLSNEYSWLLLAGNFLTTNHNPLPGKGIILKHNFSATPCKFHHIHMSTKVHFNLRHRIHYYLSHSIFYTVNYVLHCLFVFKRWFHIWHAYCFTYSVTDWRFK